MKLFAPHATQPVPLALISNPGSHTHESKNVDPVEDTRVAPTPQDVHGVLAVVPLYELPGQTSQLEASVALLGWNPAMHLQAALNVPVTAVKGVFSAPTPQLVQAPLPALPL